VAAERELLAVAQSNLEEEMRKAAEEQAKEMA